MDLGLNLANLANLESGSVFCTDLVREGPSPTYPTHLQNEDPGQDADQGWLWIRVRVWGFFTFRFMDLGLNPVNLANPDPCFVPTW